MEDDGAFTAAIEDYTDAIRLNPADGEAYEWRGYAYLPER